MQEQMDKLFNNKLARVGMLILLAFLVYFKTLNYGFVLDDDLVVQNAFVQDGFAGIPDIVSAGYLSGFNGESFSYRPIPLISFAIEQSLFELNPSTSHFIQLVLYMLLVWMITRLLRAWFSSFSIYFIWMLAMLYLVHPIHTEVVANLKSRDELLAGLFVVVTLWLVANGKYANAKLWILSAFSALLAFLSKESAIALVLVAPASLIILKEVDWKQALKASFGIWIAAIAYFCLRSLILDSNTIPQEQFLINNAFIDASFLDRVGNSAVLFWMYLFKSFVPINLTWDYSYSTIQLQHISSLKSILSLVGLIGVISVFVWKFKSLKTYLFLIFAFGAFLITVLNLFVLIGANFAERFLLIPSLFSIVIVGLLVQQFQQKFKFKNAAFLVFGLITCIWAVASIDRVQDWENNETLFAASLITNPESARVQIANGTVYREKAEAMAPSAEQEAIFRKAISHYDKAVEILPTAFDAFYNEGVIFQRVGRPDLALSLFKKTVEINASHVNAHNNLGVIYFNEKKLELAEEHWTKAYELQPTNPDVVGNMGVLAHTRGDYQTARNYYQQSLALKPNQPIMIQNLNNLKSK